ncbi:F-box and WD repeat domain containing 8 [Basidiobolus ranarum]|uniref:F-box and WD repeat domain containing 8 n=1 Tax=Basidiobolus ranarum TaxID=34480 RepID=A0ABR2VMF0_9FUNG
MHSTNCDLPLSLSPELLVIIFSYLPAPDLCSCALVSLEWRVLSNDESLWFALCKRSWENKKSWLRTLRQMSLPSDGVRHLPAAEVSLALKSNELLLGLNHAQQTALMNTKSPINPQPKWKLRYTSALRESQRTQITTKDICGEWVLQVGIRQKCDPIHAQFCPDFSYCSENTGSLKWELVGNTVCIQDFPPLCVTRTSDWGWRLSCPYFTFYST